METDDLTKDDFLGRLIQQSPLESPSDDFVDKVMAGIQQAPESRPLRPELLSLLKKIFPVIFLLVMFVVVICTSDIPFLNWLPGKNYYFGTLLPYIGNSLSCLKDVFSSKYFSLGMTILFSGAVLFLVDHFFTRRTVA